MSERKSTFEPLSKNKPVIGGRYRYFEGNTEYIVDGVGFDVDDYGTTGQLHDAVFYHQIIAGDMPVGTNYSLKTAIFLGTTLYDGKVVNRYEFLENTRVKIVQLQSDSWKVLRDLKLKSLAEEPIAFEDQKPGLERYRVRTEAEWRKKLDEEASSTISVFAQDGFKYIGMVNGVMRPSMETALVQHMYVDPEYRGQKVGKKLLKSLLEKLKGKDVKVAVLTVVEDQMPARKLYESLGFKEIGRIQAKRGSEYVTEIEMALKL